MTRQYQQNVSGPVSTLPGGWTNHLVKLNAFCWCLTVVLAISAFSGCGLNQWVHNGFKVGPNYCKPAVPVSNEWIDYRDPNIQSAPADLATWWTVFRDPALNDLVAAASRQNINLRVAGMRILEARYRRQIAVGELFPQLQEAAGSYSRNKLSASVANPPPNLWYNNADVGFNASWELDFWGRFRRAVEFADAELDVSIENYDDVLVLLLAEVASSYVEMRTYQERWDFAIKNVAAQENSLKIAQDKYKHGAASQRDVEQARTVLEQTRALVPAFEAGQRLANNRLCLLLGIPPQDMIAMRLGAGRIPLTPPQVAVGIPADLVRRRPDVRRAEREVAAQSARIGIATSDLYPHFSINGTFGYAAQNFNELFDGSPSMVGGIGPAFRWDVLNYGRLVNNIRVHDAKFQQAAYAYQEKVLEAGREAEDGIVKFLSSHRRSKSLDAAAEAAESTRVITTNQYTQGAVDFTAVYIAESELSQVQDLAATARGQIAQSLIELYRALGGGWEMRLLPEGSLEARGTAAAPLNFEPKRNPEVPEPPGPQPAP
jgi:NodT family efflux transporter outer membrane factor (OMF) lipoprotein